ncbi:hypothetical protein TELCIR_07081 [Teladorsagia circumcincta]|uniref:7TM chemoreceptor n=1 Tax=Teladorsagia circumcincta TaxID=45464 RepID=A0A2G9ULA3_TELCI|nr:hypothetical protein TELCIR_07081 [Teladorsagia circumcincta]
MEICPPNVSYNPQPSWYGRKYMWIDSGCEKLGHTAENREHSVRILRYSSKSSYAYLLRACIILIASSAAISSTGFAAYVVKFDQETIATIAYSFTSDDEGVLRAVVEAKFGYNMNFECVSGHENILKWNVFPYFLHMTLPITPVYMSILVLRRLTAMKLQNEKTISKSSRRLQSQLLQALIVQTCLPMFFSFAAITSATGQLNIYHHPILEHLTTILLGFAPMLTPLTSLYFIGPYRAWMLRTFVPRKKAIVIAPSPSNSTAPTISCTPQNA